MIGRILRIPCEVYSRVVGYFRPVANWNKGKQAEFGDRKVFDAAVSIGTIERRDEAKREGEVRDGQKPRG